MSTKTRPEVKKASIPHNDRSIEMEWLAAHEGEYAGEWVFLEGDRLVAHGDDPLPFREIAQAKGIEIPFIVHIRKEKGPFMGGWL